MEQARALWSDVVVPLESLRVPPRNASAICILTEWEQFRALDFERLARIVATPILLDFRNIYSAEQVTRHGFAYFGLGTAPAMPEPLDVAGDQVAAAE